MLIVEVEGAFSDCGSSGVTISISSVVSDADRAFVSKLCLRLFIFPQ